MGFIDEGVANAFFGVGVAPGVGVGGSQTWSGKYVGLWVLNGSPGIGRYAFCRCLRAKIRAVCRGLRVGWFLGGVRFPRHRADRRS